MPRSVCRIVSHKKVYRESGLMIQSTYILNEYDHKIKNQAISLSFAWFLKYEFNNKIEKALRFFC